MCGAPAQAPQVGSPFTGRQVGGLLGVGWRWDVGPWGGLFWEVEIDMLRVVGVSVWDSGLGFLG